MLYNFPLENNVERCGLYIQKPSLLSNEQIDKIREYGDTLETTSVKLFGKHDERHVKATGSHMPLNDETRWLYDHMAKFAQEINEETYQYIITGFEENFYYLSYQEPNEHFGWHIDAGPKTKTPRKLSIVLQLSDPTEYDGGDLELFFGMNPCKTTKLKGLVTVFPSPTVHRVTPVTRGIRKTLTIFAAGPRFR